ncbi:proline dehydrogenase [Tilletia horrida]|nr:proline dehydrogenase [Tilletia horrida]
MVTRLASLVIRHPANLTLLARALRSTANPARSAVHELLRPSSALLGQLPLGRFHSSSSSSNHSAQRPRSMIWRVGLGVGLGAGVAVFGLVALSQPIHADGSVQNIQDPDWEEEEIDPSAFSLDGAGRDPSRPLAHLPFSALMRSYIVYTLCRFPILVDAAPALLDWAENTRLPFVASLAHWIFRRTFFDQFVGGETAEASADVIRSLDSMGLGTIFVYSVEYLHDKKAAAGSSRVPVSTSAIQQSIVDELVHSVEVGSAASASSAHDIMVAIKLSGLLRDPHILERASAAIVPRELFSHGPPVPTPPAPHTRSNTPHGALSIPLAALPGEEQAALRELWQALRRVTLAAKRAGNVRLLIDAEYSWYQPAIDAMYEALAAEFNALGDEEVRRRGPLVFNTFQAYLRRTPSFLSMSLERARAHGYALGVKLVRGAYVEIENKCWRDTVVDPPPTARARTASELANDAWGSPVWPTKQHSDECYDACARLLVDEVANDWEAERAAREKNRKGSKTEEEARKFRRTAVIFASHNLQSGLKAIRRMADRGLAFPHPASQHDAILSADAGAGQKSKPALVNLALAEELAGRITFGQLYGMADTVSARLLAAFASDPSPQQSPSSSLSSSSSSSGGSSNSSSSGGAGIMVLKYLPYGPLELVMPYLIRRATENKSVVGGGAAARELSAVWAEMWRRCTLWG